jgi:hypothetical protein
MTKGTMIQALCFGMIAPPAENGFIVPPRAE